MKKYLFTLIALLCLGFTMNAQVNLQEGLVGYWPFNGNANDESGNGNHGTVNGATLTADRFGNTSSAYYFNGIDNFIVINDNDLLDITESFTLSVWVNPNLINEGHNRILNKHYANQEYNGTWDFGIYDGKADFNASPFFSPDHSSNSSINENVWSHLLFAYDNSGNSWKLFINGTLDSEGVCVFEITNNSYNLFVGVEEYESFQWFFQGKIDDIRIYNRALNGDEILALYNEKNPLSFENQTKNVGRIIEIPVLTSELTASDIVIAYQFDFSYDNSKLEYLSNSLTGTLAVGGSLQVNPTTGKLAIAWARETPIVGEGAIIKLQFKVIDAGVTTPTITNALYNTEAVNATNGTITATYKYGDIDANDHVQAYDAALAIQYSVGLDPIPAIDPLPWENWRIVTANVDGVGGVTANDASEILKYTVGLITQFPVEVTKKSGSASNANISISVENSEIVLNSTGELYGLNVFVNENFSHLGHPVSFVENALFAKNITASNYAFAIATAYSPQNNTNIVRIPYSTTQSQSVTFDMIVNTNVLSVTVGLTTGIVTINEQSVILYPNPANSVLYLSGVENANVSIFDISGRNVLNQLNVNEQVDISVLPKGLYTVKIENGKESITRKLIKN
jgi:hypothetical protein